jgi:NAD(P)-dependent dehydrogenase (short-subunit alcohol dehydrogenase family)
MPSEHWVSVKKLHYPCTKPAECGFNRVGTPQAIADGVAFLVSEEARWLTGQELYANSGCD